MPSTLSNSSHKAKCLPKLLLRLKPVAARSADGEGTAGVVVIADAADDLLREARRM